VLSEGTSMVFEQNGVLGGARAGKTWSVELERRGPAVVTIAAKGTYARASGEKIFRYTVRLSFIG
jgi:hypothetical protein